MAVKKSELYSSLWKSCDELRGGMDASQYKDYVLVLLFMKYVSDKAASRRDYLLDVPPGARFEDMVAAKGQKDIGDRINKIIAKLADANPSLRGAIDVANFNDPDKLGKGQEMVDRLTKLIGIFQNPALDFRSNTAEGDDLLGDAYEYLMRNFATESGKSKGQFYTPAEVSRVMAAVVGLTGATSNTESIYDPTCGSGSLLLKAHAAAKTATGYDLAIYGQEMDNATAALARMNMVLHDAETAEIWQDNTLARPHWTDGPGKLKRFDFCVANPPFSQKAWTTGFDPEHDEFGRFPYGLPPTKNGDYAFLLHMLASLKSTGRAAVILPHGVLFRANAEGTIRKALVSRGFVEAIIGLPPNLFYGTGIPACVIVIDKAGGAARGGILMIDASRGFQKDGNKNRLREQDIRRIVNTFETREEIPHYSSLVRLADIEEQGFNLNLARYIDTSEPEDLHDLHAHLAGGVPERDIHDLDLYWSVLPTLRSALFGPTDRPGYLSLRVAANEVQRTVADNADLRKLEELVLGAFHSWRGSASRALSSFRKGDSPKHLIAALGQDMLGAFSGVALVDRYGVYQRLMNYWSATLQDDAYLVAESGWLSATRPHLLVDGKGAKGSHDFELGKHRYSSDLLPASVLVSRFFPSEAAAIRELEARRAAIDEELSEMVELYGRDGGVLEDAIDDNGRLATRLLKVTVEELNGSPSDEADDRVPAVALGLVLEHSRIKAELRMAGAKLDSELAAAYGQLTEETARDLVVEAKWLNAIETSVREELAELTSPMIRRVEELARRYASPLSDVRRSVDEQAKRVESRLHEMGV
ncbi:MAG TPA: class I SAM-dependent DNA methyltransferase [Candidatus Limnocylindrales bacterium]